MTVFKSYWTLVKDRKVMCIVYIAIFLGITLINSSFAIETGKEMYQSAAVKIAIENESTGEFGDGLEDYLGTLHTVVPFENEEDMKESLFLRGIEFIVRIPKEGKEVVVVEIPNSTTSIYLKAQIQEYIQIVSAYEGAGFSTAEAIQYFQDGMQQEAAIEVYENTKGETYERPNYNYMINYYPYLFISISCYAVSTTLSSYREKRIRQRIACSATENKKIVGLGVFFFTLSGSVFYLLMIILPSIMYGESLINDNNLGWYLLNILASLLVAINIGFLLGMLNVREEVVTIGANVISLALSFLGGVFVPLALMGESIKNVAQLVPSYWFVVVNDILGTVQTLTGKNLELVQQSIAIQFGFAIAFACIALAAGRYSTEKE